MKRIYIKRSELNKVNVMDKVFGLIDTKLDVAGTKEYDHKVIDVRSLKKGNTSRKIAANPVEIENVSGLYYVLFTDRLVRSLERTFIDDREVEIEPIARLQYTNYIIAKIKQKDTL